MSCRRVPPDPRPRAARAVKRAFDLARLRWRCCSSAPVLVAACVAIRLESRGSPIYRQRRVGKGGAPFDLYKLRTMVSGRRAHGRGPGRRRGRPAHHARGRAAAAVLARRAAEPAQRPARGDEPGRAATDRAGAGRPSTRAPARPAAVEPGITGWAQVRGRAALPWHERIELDLWYIEHWSLRLDLRILAATVRLLLSGKGLYRGETGGWRD